MKQFVRITTLTNIGGRADYISNPERQEYIVDTSPEIDWKPYQEFERSKKKSVAKSNEGRELVIALPNSWAKLPPEELRSRANTIAQIAVGKSTDLQWAIHWNHDKTNLHMHVIFSERQREKKVKRWDRDIYLTEDGKVATRKADRAKNPDGTYKPPFHRKGEEKGGFTAKDKAYGTKEWLSGTKDRLKQTFKERWNFHIQEPRYLHQYHEGKGKDAPTIHTKNEVIKAINSRLFDLKDIGKSEHNLEYNFLQPIKANLKDCKLVVPYYKDEDFQLLRFSDPSRALKFIKQTQHEWFNGIISIKEYQQFGIYSRKLTKPQPRTPQPTNAALPTEQPVKAKLPVEQPVKPEPKSKPPVEQPTFSFTAILQAQRDYYRALFAWLDKRKPLNPSLADAPERFQNAVDAFFKAKAEETSLWRIYREYDGITGFLHRSEKKQALDNYQHAEATANKLGEKVADYMHFTSISGREEFIRRSPFDSYTGEPTPDVAEKIHDTLSQLRRTIADARPDNIPAPSRERRQACEEHFREEARKIPFEQRETARELLMADLWNLKMGDRDTDASTRRTVEQVAKDFLPTPAEIRKQEQQHSRSISRKEKER